MVDVAVDEVDDDEEVLELPHALRAAAAMTSTTRSAERTPIMPPASRKPSRTVERPAGPLRSNSGLRYARARAGSVLVVLFRYYRKAGWPNRGVGGLGPVANDTTGWRPIVFDVEHALEGADDPRDARGMEFDSLLWSLFNVAAIYARA